MYTIRLFIVSSLAGLFFVINSFAFSNFTNYQSVIRVNDIAVSKGKAWAASSGGLICIDLNTQSRTLLSDGYCFPDLDLTSIDIDSKGNIWIGTKLGYLYKRTPEGACSVFDSYYGSQWEIRDVLVYRDYVIVASSKGVSLFDTKKEVAIRNATAIDSSGDASVYSLAIHKDSLYAGCNKSFNAVNVLGDNLLNIDKSKWNTSAADKPITSFIDSSGKLLPCELPAAIVGTIFYRCTTAADTSFIYADTARVFSIGDKITGMVVDDNQNLWFGTEQNFLYCLNSAGITHYTIPGLTFNSINRVYAARNGAVWLLSDVSDKSWWEGINRFDGQKWQLYNRFAVANFGTIGGAGGVDFRGICEDRNGNIWLGTKGSSVKFYDVQKNQWAGYYIAGYSLVTQTIIQFPLNEAAGYWGAHEAIVQDSSGYMWFSNFDPQGIILSGPLVCYDATNQQNPNYRRFFPKETSGHYAINITCLCVDSKGKILAAADSRFLAVSHNGNPIKDGLTVELDQNDVNVADLCSTPDSTTWIATSKGLFKYISGSGALTPDATIQTAITSVTAENENVLWLGTSSAGLIRYEVGKNAKTIFDRGNGLVSNAVNSLSIDKKGGYLWIGTEEGISRYYLGHSDVPVAGNTAIAAYPNPYSFSNPNHRMIVFKHCAADARVLIYSMNGTLVKQLSRASNALNPVDDNAYESTLFWVPPKNLAPGAYYFVGHPQKPKTTKKLIIVP
jgi:ligand-binding sensor domain-containing protein